jgi:hypothetical protein
LTEIVTWVRKKRIIIDLYRTPLILYTFGFAAFTLLDFDYCPDMFPLLPVMALSIGWLVFVVALAVQKLVQRFVGPQQAKYARWLVGAAVIALLTYVYLFDVSAYVVRGVNFQDQMDVVSAARQYLEPGDTIMTFGNAIVPVELHMQNAHKILHIGSKSGLGVLASEPGGVQGMIDTLEKNPPKLVSIARETRPEWSQPIYLWLEEHYVEVARFPRANMRLLLRKN